MGKNLHLYDVQQIKMCIIYTILFCCKNWKCSYEWKKPTRFVV